MPPPIFVSSLVAIQPGRNLDGTPKSRSKLKGMSSLLVAVEKFIGENIKKRMCLLLVAWDTRSNIVSFGSKLNIFIEYVEYYLNNEEGFYKDVVITFTLKLYGMTELKRKEEDLPSLARIKQLKSCWIKKIKVLKEILDECDVVVIKKETLYCRLTKIDIAGPQEKHKTQI
jgi:hypothetical protein